MSRDARCDDAREEEETKTDVMCIVSCFRRVVGVRRVQPRRSPDRGGIVGNRSRGVANPARSGRWYPPRGPGGVREHVPRRSHVRADQGTFESTRARVDARMEGG